MFFVIAKHSDQISLKDWNMIIETTPYLERMPDRAGVNPFTKEPILFSAEGKAYVLVEGRRVGNISLEKGRLLTTGVPKRICAELALKLGAQVWNGD